MGVDLVVRRAQASRNPLVAVARLPERSEVFQQEKAAEGLDLRRGRIATRGLLQRHGRRQSRHRCSSNRTRPVSWLEPETSGTHPRTKGARYFAGGHRRRVPFTPKGLRAARSIRDGQVARRPFGIHGIAADQLEPHRMWFADEQPSRRAESDRGRAHRRKKGKACSECPAGMRGARLTARNGRRDRSCQCRSAHRGRRSTWFTRRSTTAAAR